MNNLSQLQDMLNTAGEHAVQFMGASGYVYGQLMVPQGAILPYIALLGHPHSLQGGTMNNKVVTTTARALQALGIVSFRFNFRGVGETEGAFDHGMGESEDMLIAAKICQMAWPQASFIFAGFSFGSYVAYRAASQWPHVLLLTIAPPVHHFDYQSFVPSPIPWAIIGGKTDEVVEAHRIEDFVHHTKAVLSVYWLDSSHFFHGKLLELKDMITKIVLDAIVVEQHGSSDFL